MVRETISDAQWSGSYGEVRGLSVSIDSNNHINTYSTHNMLVNNQEGQVANFSIEYSHVLEQKNEVGNYEEEDNNTVPVPPDNGDFNVNGDSSYDHNDLFRDRGGRYGTVRSSDHQGEEGGEYRLVAYTGLRANTAGYDGSVHAEDNLYFSIGHG